MSGFVPASEYRRTTAPTPATDAPETIIDIVPGIECQLSGYILTSEVILRGYCASCTRRVSRSNRASESPFRTYGLDEPDGCRVI